MKNKKHNSELSENSIKEAFDNLPSGVCFFDKNGMIVLCNYQMYRLAFELTGRDLQSLAELKDALNFHGKNGTVTRDNCFYILRDNSVWQFFEKNVTGQFGDEYIQYTASNVTELYKTKLKLAEENERMKKIGIELKQLSDNVVTEMREKEILSMKMKVHNDIGSGIVTANRILKENKPMTEACAVICSWEKAIGLLNRANEDDFDNDELEELKSISAGMGIEIVVNGRMPKNSRTSYLLVTAMRECVTNAAKYAKASKVYVTVKESNGIIYEVITNDGNPPECEIIEGGGLSNLRQRISFEGGSMKISSEPVFELMITLPQDKEETL